MDVLFVQALRLHAFHNPWNIQDLYLSQAAYMFMLSNSSTHVSHTVRMQ